MFMKVGDDCFGIRSGKLMGDNFFQLRYSIHCQVVFVCTCHIPRYMKRYVKYNFIVFCNIFDGAATFGGWGVTFGGAVTFGFLR